jgi:hypothetical protein
MAREQVVGAFSAHAHVPATDFGYPSLLVREIGQFVEYEVRPGFDDHGAQPFEVEHIADHGDGTECCKVVGLRGCSSHADDVVAGIDEQWNEPEAQHPGCPGEEDPQ